MEYELKDKDGKVKRYEVSYSQELQKEQLKWEKFNFAAKISLVVVGLGILVMLFYFFWRLDQMQFFTRILANR